LRLRRQTRPAPVSLRLAGWPFHVTIGDAVNFKGVAIVHLPSRAINNSKKSRGTMFCYPPLDELIQFGVVKGISADNVRQRVDHYGPSMRHLCDQHIEVTIASAVRDVVGEGIEDLTWIWTRNGSCAVH
jgi:hypothetical protein